MTSFPLDPRRKKLLFRALHRGTKEADRLVGGFAEARLATLDDGQLDRFERLLDLPDPDLVDWIIGRRPPPPEHAVDVLDLMIASYRSAAS